MPIGLRRGADVLERCAFAGGAVALVCSFGVVLYLYQFSPAKPDLAALAFDLQQRAGEQITKWM
jgi:hypothetical protein